jgi:hypothetical protein
MKILVSITTTTNADWRKKIEEVKKLGLSEVALFVSAIGLEERQELYAKLGETKIKSIPFVHLRTDMSTEEVRELFRKYQTKAANIHSQKEFPLKYDFSEFKEMIYLENTDYSLAEEVKQWAGICLDTSHQESKRLTGNNLYQELIGLLEKYPIGAWHLNAIKLESKIHGFDGGIGYDYHFFQNLCEFDYCLNYKQYLPKYYIALELENSLSEQLTAKAYVEKIIGV